VRALGYSYFSKPLLLATTAPPTRGRATAACFNACCRFVRMFVYTYTHEQILFQDNVLVFSIQGLSNYSQKKPAGFCMCTHANIICVCLCVHTHTHRCAHTRTLKRTSTHSHTSTHTRTHIANSRVYGWESGVWGLEFSLGFRQRVPPRQCRARKQDRTFLPVLLILWLSTPKKKGDEAMKEDSKQMLPK
jgi:hypothetical protein